MNWKSALRPRGWHVPRRKMRRISCLFLCLKNMKNLSQSDALSKSNSTDEKMSRIPLVLTYHPLNTRVQRILLDNFKVIADDPATSHIFPLLPMVAFRRDDNLRTSLVHTSERQAATRAGTYPCQHPRCRTCGHISSETDLLGPKDRLTIRDSFTCLSSGLIYCISCRRCPAIYIGENGRTLRGTIWWTPPQHQQDCAWFSRRRAL